MPADRRVPGIAETGILGVVPVVEVYRGAETGKDLGIRGGFGEAGLVEHQEVAGFPFVELGDLKRRRDLHRNTRRVVSPQGGFKPELAEARPNQGGRVGVAHGFVAQAVEVSDVAGTTKSGFDLKAPVAKVVRGAKEPRESAGVAR